MLHGLKSKVFIRGGGGGGGGTQPPFSEFSGSARNFLVKILGICLFIDFY